MKIFATSVYKPEINSGIFMAAKSTFNSNLITTENDAVQKETILNADVLNFTKYNTFESPIIPKRFTSASPSLHISEIIGSLNELLSKQQYENMFDISSDVLTSVNAYYSMYEYAITDVIYTNVINVISPKTDKDNPGGSKELEHYIQQSPCAMSLFNDWYGIDLTGFELFNKYISETNTKNPVSITVNGIETQEQTTNNKTPKLNINKMATFNLKQIEADITDCRTSTLIAESLKFSNYGKALGHSDKLGWETFKMTDFMYCRDAGRISNNRLITLRIFPYPIGDDIKTRITGDNDNKKNYSPDRGRMLCWLNEENKLEDILQYKYEAKWKQFDAKIQEEFSKEDNDKLLNSIMNLGAPKNFETFSKGFSVLNSNSFVGETSFVKAAAKGPYEMNLLTNYDNNEIYMPKDTIRSTHKYDGELSFNHDFKLVFDYELRAYENINPRTAFLDLLANIHAVTYRRGNFWGGQAKINGTLTNKKGWEIANDLITGGIDTGLGVIGGLLNGTTNLDSVWSFMGNALSSLPGIASNLVQSAKDFLNNDDNKKKIWNSSKDFVTGVVKNSLGRPAQYAFDSLLTGDKVGLWHVTIGNPFRPILSIGNLILKETSIQHLGPLGIDDFPTKLKVTVNLAHAMPRDIIEIQKMYTDGQRTISSPFKSGAIDIKNYKTVVGLSSFNSTPKNTPIFNRIRDEIANISV